MILEGVYIHIIVLFHEEAKTDLHLMHVTLNLHLKSSLSGKLITNGDFTGK